MDEKAGWTTNSMDDIGISTYLSAKQCDIRSFYVEHYIGCPYPWVLGGHGCDIIVHGCAWVGMVHGIVHEMVHGRWRWS